MTPEPFGCRAGVSATGDSPSEPGHLRAADMSTLPSQADAVAIICSAERRLVPCDAGPEESCTEIRATRLPPVPGRNSEPPPRSQ
jgi:hypothetical protein